MSNIYAKRILIVDDEPNVATMVALTLEDMGDEYIFDTVHNAEEALTRLQQTSYALLITDYNMPGMTGLDLAQTVRHISPSTQVILMTAYGTNQLRQKIENLKLDGYIDKPATPAQIREIVQRAVERVQVKPEPMAEQVIDEETQKHLKTLQTNTNARCVLLISSSGYPVSVVGATSALDVSSVSALVAANFLAAVELANLLGSESSMFKSSYYEGNDYNVYSYDINEELIIAVIFGAESKPGVVWFYTKQTVTELEPLVTNMSTQFEFEADDVDAALDAGFNDLFGNDDLFDDQALNGNGAKQFEQAQIAPNPPAKPQNNKKTRPMTFEQAVSAGLVPSQIVNREQK